MLQSHTDIEALRGILSPCDDPQFAWSGLPEHEIERVVTISQKLGEANRDRIFSIDDVQMKYSEWLNKRKEGRNN